MKEQLPSEIVGGMRMTGWEAKLFRTICTVRIWILTMVVLMSFCTSTSLPSWHFGKVLGMDIFSYLCMCSTANLWGRAVDIQRTNSKVLHVTMYEDGPIVIANLWLCCLSIQSLVGPTKLQSIEGEWPTLSPFHYLLCCCLLTCFCPLLFCLPVHGR